MSGRLSAGWLELAERHREASRSVGELLRAWNELPSSAHSPPHPSGPSAPPPRRAGRAPAEPDRRSAADRASDALRNALVAVDPAGARPLAEADLAATSPASPDRGWRQCILAQILYRLSETQAALALINEAFHCGRAHGDEHLVLAAVVQQSRLYTRLGEVAHTAAVMQDGIELARQLGDLETEGVLLTNLGFLHATQDRPEPYEKYTRKALAIFRALGNERREAQSLANLGGALARMHRLDEAEATYRDGMALAIGLGDASCESLLLSGLGGLCCARGDFAGGLELYRRSEVLLESLHDHFQISRQALLVGRHLVEASRYAEAAPHLERAIALADARGFRGNVAEARELLARVLENVGDFSGAIRELRQHLALRERLVESRIEERVQAVELRCHAESARAELEWATNRAADLEAANAELRAALEREQELKAALDRLARTDALTGLANRRHLQEFLAQELGRARRRWRPMALAILDVDHFKSVNDLHGHAVGDEVLVELGLRLVRAVRTVDVVARWGGEEFCLCLLETEGETAREVAQRLLTAINGSPFPTSKGPVRVTASIGLADLLPEHDTVDRLEHRADAALYAAKLKGRNRVERHEEPAPPSDRAEDDG